MNHHTIPFRPARRWLAGLCLLTGAAQLPALAGEPETPSALVASPQGWLDLMPPADLHGWTRVAIPPTKALGRAQWHLDQARQILVCDGDGGHEMLRFDQELVNCIFHVEFRFVPVKLTKHSYNSGIFIRDSADGTVWHQCQLTLNGGYLFGNTPSAGHLKRFHSPTLELRMKPAGEWNTAEITAQGSTLTAWLNGAVVSVLNDCEMSSGYIALEAEYFHIEFRNLKLKKLP